MKNHRHDEKRTFTAESSAIQNQIGGKTMKRKMIVLLAALFALAAPLAAFAAMEHGDQGKKEKMDHSQMKDMKHGGHGGMEMHGDMAMLGEQTKDGVKAMAHLNDVKEAMAKVGMKETHLFMVAFVDAAGEPVTEGTVAVKFKDGAGQEIGRVKLLGMEGHLGADIVLEKAG
jgi:hypothetical protein